MLAVSWTDEGGDLVVGCLVVVDCVCDVIRRTSDGAFDFNSFEPVKTKIGFAGLVSRAGFPRGYSALHKVG